MCVELSDNLVEEYFEEELNRLEKNISNEENVLVFSPFWIDRKVVGEYLEKNIDVFSYLNCVEYDSLYKILSKLIEDFLDEHVSTGHHTSSLKKKLNNLAYPIVVFLDNFDFVDSKDRNNLLYFLSRETKTKCIFIGSSKQNLGLDNRVKSSLMPKETVLNQNSTILFSDELKAKKDLKNIKKDYRDSRIKLLSKNHRLLFDKIEENWQKTGEIYSNFNQDDRTKDLSLRRIEMLIDDLEKLNLIRVDKVEGGSEGRTQLIKHRDLES